MATLNITYNGLSADYPFALDKRASDEDVRRIAVEAIRAGNLPGLHIANLPVRAFDFYVVDRFHDKRDVRIYLRPKVPFG